MANEVHNFNIGGVDHEVQDLVARQAVAAVQTALDALTSGDTTTAIKTFQEVIDFLAGVTDSETLIGKLNVLNTAINGKYTKPNDGIPASDLANAVQTILNSVSGKVDAETGKSLMSADEHTKLAGLPTGSQLETAFGNMQDAIDGLDTAVEGKQDALTFDNVPTANSNNVVKSGGVKSALDNKANASDVYPKSQTYTKQEVDDAIEDAIEDMPTGDIPEKVSDLTNDLGFITAAALVDVVTGNGDFAMTYDDETDTYNIIRLVPTLVVGALATLSESTKSGTFTISGTNLKGNVTISTSATNWTLQVGSGTASQLLTLTPTDGVLAETTITVAYSGTADSIGNTITIASTGVESESVTASYYEHNGIFVDANSLSFSEVVGYSDSKVLAVGGSQLTGNISAALSGTGSTKFALSTNSLGSSGGNLTITYTPASGDNNVQATLTLSSDGAADVTVALTGNALTQTLTVSTNSLSMQSASGTSTTGTFTVSGTNLKQNVSITLGSGVSGFSVSPASISPTNGTINAETVTVTADTTSASGSVVVSSGSLSETVGLSWEVQEVDPVQGGYVTKKIGQKNGVDTPIAVDASGNQIGIEFKVTAVAATNTSSPTDTDGEVTVVSKPHAEAFTNDVYSNNYTTVKTLVIPDTITINGKYYRVTEMANYAFGYCSAITSATIGNNVKTIGSNMFHNVNLYYITIGNNVETINAQFLNWNSNVTTLNIPDSVTSVANYAFRVTGLTSLTVGTGLSAISYLLDTQMSATYPSIGSITLKTDAVAITIAAFINALTKSTINLYVPNSQIANYKADSTWGQYIYDETNNPSGKFHIQAITSK